MNGRFQCNRFIAGDIVTSECSGVVHWYFAGRFDFEMVEEKGQFDGILYKWAMEALKIGNSSPMPVKEEKAETAE